MTCSRPLYAATLGITSRSFLAAGAQCEDYAAWNRRDALGGTACHGLPPDVKTRDPVGCCANG